MAIDDDDATAVRRGELLPVPDPTRLTTELVDRALAAFREVVETRLAGMDQATKLVAADVARILAVSEAATTHLREDFDRQLSAQATIMGLQIDGVGAVASEKFAGIQSQFAERDTRLEQTDKERRISLDAALAAAKEAVAEQQKANALAIGKSEDGTKERLDALGLLMSTSNAAMSDKIEDIKERLTRAEASAATRTESRTETRLNLGQVLVAASVVIAAIALILAFAGKG